MTKNDSMQTYSPRQTYIHIGILVELGTAVDLFNHSQFTVCQNRGSTSHPVLWFYGLNHIHHDPEVSLIRFAVRFLKHWLPF